MRGPLCLLGIGMMTACLGACEAPNASLEITGTRAARTDDNRVAVEVDLVAREALGKNVGIYCTRATFAGDDTNFVEQCAADLRDGDSKTVRLVSKPENKAINPGDAIFIRVRLDYVDVGRTLAAPAR